mmetsp:Transcript_33679/g.85104  ORF Transcript_33679/g.85104 Transcript_33679/m.85104 type:complete len:111 (+) Transcript_33679:2-334(+)
MFCILTFEEYHYSEEFIRDSQFLYIVFEFCSAYGTSGLSMSSGAASLCRSWCPQAKVLLMVVMFLGRVRGLPESIDPTFSFVEIDDRDSDTTSTYDKQEPTQSINYGSCS